MNETSGRGCAYVVGQRVWCYDVNARSGPHEGTVTKVGRTLVTVENRWSQPEQYRIDTGQKNDRNYGSHYWIKTDGQRAADERLAAVGSRIHAHGLRFDHGVRLPIEVLEGLLAVLDTPHASDESCADKATPVCGHCADCVPSVGASNV